MFEVGKEYSNNRTKDKAKIITIDGVDVFARWENEGRAFILYQSLFSDGWYEVKQPVVKKTRRQVVHICGETSTRQMNVGLREDILLGVVEFTVTDGKLTNVEIV